MTEGSTTPHQAAPLPERLEQRLLSGLLELYQCAGGATEQAIVQQCIEQAVALTDSAIGYIHFVNEDQETIELGTWSHRTLALCSAVYDRHYPISAAGVWADCARHRRPFVHNDYPALAHRAGYPEGHVELRRHLGVPVLERDQVRILIGVGNKQTSYGEPDIVVLGRLGAAAWDLVQRHRETERLRAQQRHLRELQQIASVASWECDPEDDSIGFDEFFAALFGHGGTGTRRMSIEAFLRHIDVTDHDRVRNALFTRHAGARFHFEITGVHREGHSLPLAFKGHLQARPRGDSMIVRGMLQDLSERRVMDEIREKAYHDTLTGLGNRNLLTERTAPGPAGERRRPADLFAVHYIDLDRFKAVNDRYGHRIGDVVLREAARRMRKLIRREDVLVRLGGDEFVMLQTGIAAAEDAAALARKFNQVIAEPYYTEGVTIDIGVSIGIALSHPGDTRDIEQLIDDADAALYHCKATAPGGYCVFGAAERDAPG